jgi:flagellin
MSSSITLTTGVRDNLLALQQISQQETTTQERLATGKKVNSALDNPTEFFTAAALTARSGELTNLLDSMSNAVNTINAASDGLTSITTTIESMEATATQALQDASWQSTSYTINTTAIGTSGIKSIGFSGGAVGSTVVAVDLNDTQQALTGSTNGFTAGSSELGGSTSGTTFTIQAADINGGVAVSVTLASSDTASAAAAAINTAAGTTIATTTSGGELQLDDPGQSNTLTVGGTASALALLGLGATATSFTGTTNGFTANGTNAELGGIASQTFTIQAADINGGNAVSVTLASSDTVSAAIAAINTAAGAAVATASGGELTLSDPGGGTLTINAPSALYTELGIDGTTATATSAPTLGAPATVDQLVNLINGNSKLTGLVKASDNAGQLQIQNLSISALTITGIGATGEVDGSSGVTTIGGNTVRANLVTQFNELRDQLDKTADDSSFNGVNLLQGDPLKVFFNETSTSTLTIQSANPNGINSNSLGITAATDTEFQNNTELQTRLQNLNTALNSVSSQASDFGSNLSIVQNRQDFTNAIINTLNNGADDLTAADTNLEGADLLALQTQQQLSITSLSLASQANQAVLKLFG